MVLLVSLILFRLLDKILKEDRSRRILIRQKNTELKIKNKEITSSLRYAKRIQDAILPPKSMLDDYLGNYFIYYKPRDIVAGDFYWSCKIDDIVYFACADCTGHGVLGAMVSVICSKSLDSDLKQYNFKKPGEILDKVSSLVEEAFEKSELDINDGMDIYLIAIDKKQNELTLAGAHNSLYQIKSSNELNQNEFIEHKTDKQPIGRYSHKAPFSQKKIKFHKGDTFYLFTDGYADQFGGEKGKKFLYREFKKLLVSISKFQLADQYKKIDKAFKNWKGKEEQVDDICVVGIKL